MKRIISNALPESIKAPFRPYLNGWKAKRLAATSKRLDICAAQLAHVMHLSGRPSLVDKTCMELGTGWVLSHALVFHLLGAKKVIAVDIQPLAHPECLKVAVGRAIGFILQDTLSPFEDYGRLRERVDRLLSMKRFDFAGLKKMGIEYISPIDLSRDRLGTTVDCIYSNSVLEHVPQTDVMGLLKNLAVDLAPDGIMMHCIHLEDHKDFVRRPFDFLTLNADAYPRWCETNTGNRMRASSWEKAFNELEACRNRVLYSFRRRNISLPRTIDASIEYKDEEDLRVGHLGILTQKQPVSIHMHSMQRDIVHDYAC